MSDKIPLSIAADARLFFKWDVDRKAGTFDGLPIAGATASLEVDEGEGRYTATRVAAGAAGFATGWVLPGLLVGLSKKKTVNIYMTVTAPDGKSVTRPLAATGSERKYKALLLYVDKFNKYTVPA